MAQEPKFQKTMNLSLETVGQMRDLKEIYGTETAVVTEGVLLLHRTHQNRPTNEDLIRGV